MFSCELVRMYVISARCSPFTGRPANNSSWGITIPCGSLLHMYIYR